MEFDQLQAFCYVAEERSFSRAARRMFVSQPAISMQIKSLEREIGQPLFDRSTRDIIPTEAGKILYAHAGRIFAEVDYARRKIDSIRQLVRGELTIGCSDTVSSYILPTLLSDFLNEYPDLDITVQNRPSLHIVRMVLEGVAEIGFVTLPLSDSNLVTTSFFSYNMVAVCAPDHLCAKRSKIDFPSLSKQRLLLLEPGTKSRMLLDETFAMLQLTPHAVMGFGSVEVQKAFARKGIGIAIVPDFAVKKDAEDGALVVLPIRGAARRKIGIIQRKNRMLSIAAQRFLSIIYAVDSNHTYIQSTEK